MTDAEGRWRQRARVWRPRDVDVEAVTVVEGTGRCLVKIGDDLEMDASRNREISKYRRLRNRRALGSRKTARASLKEQVERPPFTLKMVSMLKGLGRA